MFDATDLAQLARKAMDRMAGEPERASGAVNGQGAGGANEAEAPCRSGRDRGRALSILRTVHPELSLRQAEALLVGREGNFMGKRIFPPFGGQEAK